MWLVDVVRFVNVFTSGFDSQAIYQRKDSLIVSANTLPPFAVASNLNSKIGVVPIIEIVPVRYRELLAALTLVLAVAQKREQCGQIELDILCLFERCSEHRPIFLKKIKSFKVGLPKFASVLTLHTAT